jgi:carboxypeptidase Q
MYRRNASVAGSRLLYSLALALLFSVPLRAQEKVDAATGERIKSEDMNHSQVMDLMSWMSDVYGPRLTWSPNLIRAGDWAMSQLKSWGLANVHEETWDTPVGLGWQNDRFAMMATAPVPFIVAAVPQAWSGSTNGTVTAPAMLIQVGCFDELKQQYAGKLKNAFWAAGAAAGSVAGVG